eukprot:12896570-Heterocapsa_arctica.AAC.1
MLPLREAGTPRPVVRRVTSTRSSGMRTRGESTTPRTARRYFMKGDDSQSSGPATAGSGQSPSASR